jgi:hypothetical protein
MFHRWKLATLLVIFSVLALNLSSANGATPRITLGFEENLSGKACAKNKVNFVYDFSAGYSDKCALFWNSNVKVSGKIFLQTYENQNWIRATQSKKWEPNSWSVQDLTGIQIKNEKGRSQTTIQLLTLDPPITEAAKRIGRRVATGDFCWAQTAGPLKFRIEFVSPKVPTIYSNEVVITYSNFDKWIFNGNNCVLGVSTTSPSPVINGNTTSANLPICSVSKIIDLKDLIRNRNQSHEIRITAISNISIQQEAAMLAISLGQRQAVENANASIDKWTRLAQEASGNIRQVELLFKEIKSRCKADDVQLPALTSL